MRRIIYLDTPIPSSHFSSPVSNTVSAAWFQPRSRAAVPTPGSWGQTFARSTVQPKTCGGDGQDVGVRHCTVSPWSRVRHAQAQCTNTTIIVVCWIGYHQCTWEDTHSLFCMTQRLYAKAKAIYYIKSPQLGWFSNLTSRPMRLTHLKKSGVRRGVKVDLTSLRELPGASCR